MYVHFIIILAQLTYVSYEGMRGLESVHLPVDDNSTPDFVLNYHCDCTMNAVFGFTQNLTSKLSVPVDYLGDAN